MSLESFAKAFAVDPEKGCDLSRCDPRDKSFFESREAAEASLQADSATIDTLQDRLFAEAKQSLLLVLQATDAAGKDGTVRKVFGPVDPLGIRAHSFKKPTRLELSHDFLWRVHQKAPAKGEIAIFNRSHYEDVLVARVHGLAEEAVIEARYDQINQFEKLLSFYGTRVVKVFLHVSKEEQRERLQERVDIPRKRWKHNPGDLAERAHWDSYQQAFEAALERCATPWGPWYVIPADRNWCRNALVARLLRLTMEDMDPQYPEPNFDPAGITVV